MALSGSSPIGYFGPHGGGIVPPPQQGQRIGYFGPNSGGIATLPPVQPQAVPTQPMASPSPQGAAIQHARQNPIVSALIAAAAGLHQHESQSSMQAHAARNAFGQEMAGAHGLQGALSGSSLGTMSPGLELSPGQPSLAHILAAAAAAHPQMGGIGGTLKRLRPGGGAQLPPQANQYPQLHPGMG